MKRAFGRAEAVFDLLYLLTAATLGGVLLLHAPGHPAGALPGIMALVLAVGDGFHLVPRMALILTGREEALRRPLGRGKQITSITMTVFYLLLWHTALSLAGSIPPPVPTVVLYLLALIRISLCLLPQNRWTDRHPPVSWAIGRNLPFVLIGAATAWFFFAISARAPLASALGAAIIVSFLFYLPVVLWSGKHPKLGILMLPKTCAYLWMLLLLIRL